MSRPTDSDKVQTKPHERGNAHPRSNHGAVAPAKVPEGWLWLGQVGRPHGVRGGFFLKTEDNRLEWPGYASLLLQNKEGDQVCKVSSTFVSGGKLAVLLEGITSREKVESLYNAHLFVARTQVKRDAEEYLVADLMGCAVQVEGREGVFGHVIAVHDFGAQETLEIQPADPSKDTVLFPFTDSFVLNLDEKEKLITIKDEPAFLDEHKE